MEGYSVEKMRNLNRKEVRSFLSQYDLELEQTVDYTAVLWHHGELVGTCSYEGNTLKSFAVKHCYQGVGASSMLLTHMLNKLFDQGHYTAVAYTTSKNRAVFEGMQFTCIYDTGQVVLMQMGTNTLEQFIGAVKAKIDLAMSCKAGKGNIIASIVMNANPFTNGHLHLVESAASCSDLLVVFVVEENKSEFDFKTRFMLVEDGTKHLSNVLVIPGGSYIVSMNTFPQYFEKDANQKAVLSAHLDAGIFCDIIAPELGIKKRYVGTEPECKLTNIYNQVLTERFNNSQVELIMLERLKVGQAVVSASSVRHCLEEKNFEAIKNRVPESTYSYLTRVESILLDREKRYEFIESLLEDNESIIVTGRLNLPGLFKNTIVSSKGCQILKEYLDKVFSAPATICHEWKGDDGHGYIYQLNRTDLKNFDLIDLKKKMVNIEETHFLGRVFDIDVYGPEGLPLSREDIGEPLRKCMVCDAPAKMCIVRKKHRTKEVEEKIYTLIEQFYASTNL